MTRLFNSIFHEKCPHCNKTLITEKSTWIKMMSIKSCPDGHYKKEIYPQAESVIEYHNED
jgi:Ribonuclease G/E